MIVTPNQSPLCNHLDKHIYVSGGEEVKNNVQRYVIDEERWELVPPMIIGRKKHSSCALGPNIYVTCGYENGKVLNSFERLDTREIESGTARWQISGHSPDVLPPRCEPAFFALNSHQLIILGGYRHGYLSDVVIYDERTEEC